MGRRFFHLRQLCLKGARAVYICKDRQDLATQLALSSFELIDGSKTTILTACALDRLMMPLGPIQKLLNNCRGSQVSCYTTGCLQVRPRRAEAKTSLGTRYRKRRVCIFFWPGLGLMALRQSDQNLARLIFWLCSCFNIVGPQDQGVGDE